MRVSLADAIAQLREDLRDAVLQAESQDIVFTVKQLEVELSFTLGAEMKAGGGIKLLTLLDVSGEAKSSESREHKIKLSLSVTDKEDRDLKVRSTMVPGGL